jgi:hypothetical protein
MFYCSPVASPRMAKHVKYILGAISVLGHENQRVQGILYLYESGTSVVHSLWY